MLATGSRRDEGLESLVVCGCSLVGRGIVSQAALTALPLDVAPLMT